MSDVHNFIDLSSCMNKLVGGNETDAIGSALCVWSSQNIWISTIVIGMIPIMLMVMVYVRTQKIAPATFVGGMSMLFVNGLEFHYGLTLVHQIIGISIYIVMIIGFALSFNANALNKEN